MSVQVLEKLVHEVVSLRRRVGRLETQESGVGGGGDFLRLVPGTVLTISNGAITVTGSYHLVSTEGGASTDDLDTINGGVAGAVLVLQRASVGQTITVRDNAGNIRLGADRVLNVVADTLMLIKQHNGDWAELSFADNA